MTEPTEDDVLATAAAGAYASALQSGTLGGIPDDDMAEIAVRAAARPHILGAMMDDSDGAIASLPPELLAMQMLDDHDDAVAADERAAIESEARDEEARRARELKAAKYAFSRMAPEDIGRMEFDAEQGDTSPMLAIEERFYLG